MIQDVFAYLQELGKAGQTADIVTLVSAPSDRIYCVGQMLAGSAGKWQGRLVDEAFTCQIAAELAERIWKKPVVVEIEYLGGKYRLFWDRLSRRRSALILGAGHISQPLTSLLTLLGYAVTVVDDRPDFANQARFPEAEQVVCREFGQALSELTLSGFGAIIVVTRGHRSDMECLRAVIDQPAGYVGMIGSQGRVALVRKAMAEAGVDAEALKRLRAPIGLNIGAETPAEIALSIAAEIVAVDREADCRPLSDRWRCK